MKGSKILVAALASGMLIGCGPDEHSFSRMEAGLVTTVGQLVTSIPEYDGTVDSWAGADSRGESIRVGKGECTWFGCQQTAGILTFDTSFVPPNATIVGVWMYLSLDTSNAGVLPENWMSYAHQNMVIDVAGPYGFGGTQYFPSFAISGFDYYSMAATTTGWVQDPMIGAVHLYNPDLNSSDVDRHVNRNGLTQIRIRYQVNPEGQRLDFSSGEVQPFSPEDVIPKPILYVIWEEEV